jgi:hypothetical protein
VIVEDDVLLHRQVLGFRLNAAHIVDISTAKPNSNISITWVLSYFIMPINSHAKNWRTLCVINHHLM